MFNDSKFFLLGVGNKNTTGTLCSREITPKFSTVTVKLEFIRKKFPLLSMLNQHFSKNYSEVICGSILIKLISLN